MTSDPLQNILENAWMALWARSKQEPGNWLAMIGDMDFTTEIHAEAERQGVPLMRERK